MNKYNFAALCAGFNKVFDKLDSSIIFINSLYDKIFYEYYSNAIDLFALKFLANLIFLNDGPYYCKAFEYYDQWKENSKKYASYFKKERHFDCYALSYFFKKSIQKIHCTDELFMYKLLELFMEKDQSKIIEEDILFLDNDYLIESEIDYFLTYLCDYSIPKLRNMRVKLKKLYMKEICKRIIKSLPISTNQIKKIKLVANKSRSFSNLLFNSNRRLDNMFSSEKVTKEELKNEIFFPNSKDHFKFILLMIRSNFIAHKKYLITNTKQVFFKKESTITCMDIVLPTPLFKQTILYFYMFELTLKDDTKVIFLNTTNDEFIELNVNDMFTFKHMEDLYAYYPDLEIPSAYNIPFNGNLSDFLIEIKYQYQQLPFINSWDKVCEYDSQTDEVILYDDLR